MVVGVSMFLQYVSVYICVDTIYIYIYLNICGGPVATPPEPPQQKNYVSDTR